MLSRLRPKAVVRAEVQHVVCWTLQSEGGVGLLRGSEDQQCRWQVELDHRGGKEGWEERTRAVKDSTDHMGERPQPSAGGGGEIKRARRTYTGRSTPMPGRGKQKKSHAWAESAHQARRRRCEDPPGSRSSGRREAAPSSQRPSRSIKSHRHKATQQSIGRSSTATSKSKQAFRHPRLRASSRGGMAASQEQDRRAELGRRPRISRQRCLQGKWHTCEIRTPTP